MKKYFLLTLSVVFIMSCSREITEHLELTFTGIHDTNWVKLDSIKIWNLTRKCDTVLYWPDTVLTIEQFKKIEDSEAIIQPTNNSDKRGFLEEEETSISNDKVEEVSAGLDTIVYYRKLDTIGFSEPRSAYHGDQNRDTILPPIYGVEVFDLLPDDEIVYVGYAVKIASGQWHRIDTSKLIPVQFVTNVPCRSAPTVTYGGQIYHTIQIFGQCWMRENLNIGTQINAGKKMTDNGVIEKYCFSNNCAKYGGLYLWDEAMNYVNKPGAKGICPQGWHVPTDEEWKILAGTIDSHYGVGDPEWNNLNYIGYDIGQNLKSTKGWISGGNGVDIVKFTAFPGGYLYTDEGFRGQGGIGYWYSSTSFAGPSGCCYPGPCSCSYSYYLYHGNNGIGRGSVTLLDEGPGLSIRCVKD